MSHVFLVSCSGFTHWRSAQLPYAQPLNPGYEVMRQGGCWITFNYNWSGWSECIHAISGMRMVCGLPSLGASSLIVKMGKPLCAELSHKTLNVSAVIQQTPWFVLVLYTNTGQMDDVLKSAPW